MVIIKKIKIIKIKRQRKNGEEYKEAKA